MGSAGIEAGGLVVARGIREISRAGDACRRVGGGRGGDRLRALLPRALFAPAWIRARPPNAAGFSLRARRAAAIAPRRHRRRGAIARPRGTLARSALAPLSRRACALHG